MQNDGQNRSLRSLFWPSCAGFHPELSAAARCARDIGHLRVCAAHSSSLNPFVKKMQAFSMTQGLRKPGARYTPYRASRPAHPWAWPKQNEGDENFGAKSPFLCSTIYCYFNIYTKLAK